MDLNKAQIIGRATSEVDLKQTPNSTDVATVSVATNSKWTDKQGEIHEDAEFHNVVMWGKLAEIAYKYLKKGKKVYFEGKLKTKKWEGQDGKMKYKTEIIADNMILLDSKGTSKKEPKEEDSLNIEDLPF